MEKACQGHMPSCDIAAAVRPQAGTEKNALLFFFRSFRRGCSSVSSGAMLEPAPQPPGERLRPPQSFLRVGCKKVLNRRDVLQASGLEIGFIFSGMTPELRHESTATPVPTCASCEAFLSKYGSANASGTMLL